jgi:hypothetical protein
VEAGDPTPAAAATDWETRAADYRRQLGVAADALVAVIRTGATDGAEAISHVLATAAANLGGMHTLTEDRPGSWEADYVDRFLASTVGPDGEHLLGYRTAPIVVVECLDQAMSDLGIDQLYDDSLMLIDAAEADASDDELEAASRRVDRAEELIEQLREHDYAAYRTMFEHRIREAARDLAHTQHLPASVEVSVQWVEWRDADQASSAHEAWGTVEQRLWEAAYEKTPPPGFAEPLHQIPGTGMPGDLLRTAGRMPHQRIPELAHYTAPDQGEMR